MSRFLYPFIIGLCALLPSVHGEFSLNPLQWFKEAPVDDYTANAAQETAARELLDKGIARMEAGNTRSASKAFKKLVKKYPGSGAAADALFFHARILRDEGRWTKAFEALQQIVVSHPGYPHFNRVIEEQFDIATLLMEGARGRIFGIFPGFRKEDKAVEYFARIVGNAPYGDYAALSLMNIAIVSQRRGDADLAIDALDRLINDYPQNTLAPDAYRRLAETYANLAKGYEYDQNSTREAMRYYEDFLILFPDNENTGEVKASQVKMENLLARSRLSIGDYYYIYRNNNTAALIFYNEAIDVAPNSESAAEARERISDIDAGVRPATGYRLARKLLFAD